ncbi:MAG TPA: MarR family transcriptional regulator [Gammaproteobacteria bacterium]|nr:MarR family transcriptional regulator [Gammaproteobacteria bacterium]
MKDDVLQKLTTISEDDYRLLTAWRDILRDFMTASICILKQTGVTTSEYQALLVIYLRTQQQQLSMGELARHLRIRNNSAVSLVNRMARQGLVRRVPSDQDSRVVHLRLTAKSESMLRKLVGAHRRELDRITPSLRNIIV